MYVTLKSVVAVWFSDKIQTHERLKRMLFIMLSCPVFGSIFLLLFLCSSFFFSFFLTLYVLAVILISDFFYSVAGHSMAFSDSLMPYMTKNCYCANCYTVVATWSLCMSSSLDLSQAFCWKSTRICLQLWSLLSLLKYLTDILGLCVLTVTLPHSWPFSERCDEDNADQTYCAGHGTCVFDVSTTNGVRCQCDKNYGGNTCSARLGKLSQFNSFHPI